MSDRFTRLPDVGAPSQGEGSDLILATRGPVEEWAAETASWMYVPPPWWEEVLHSGLPAPPEPWRTQLIPAGLWLFRGQPSTQDAAVVTRIPADPERLAIVVGATEPDRAILAALDRVLAGLPEDCPRAVRLFLPFVAPQTARAFARTHKLDLVAVPAGLRIQGPLMEVAGFNNASPDGFWQWYRTRSGAPALPCGALYPQPRWEEALTGHSVVTGQKAVTVGRIPAGFAVRPLGKADVRFQRFAAQIPASADRLRVVVQTGGIDPLLMTACSTLLDALPTAATRQVELLWPYAGIREASGPIGEMAARLEASVVAPAAGFALHDNGHDLVAVHPSGALGHWVRFTADGNALPHGPLSPQPGWGRQLSRLLGDLPPAGAVRKAPSGVHLRGGLGPEQAALAATLAPDREGVTVLADGDARREADQDRVLALLDRFGSPLLTGLRVVMSFACEGESGSFAQALADRLRVRVFVATDESIDLAGTRADSGPQLTALEWKRFLPGAAAFPGGTAAPPSSTRALVGEAPRPPQLRALPPGRTA
ncbi:hypothetical protein [Streptomyces sp. NPDC048527]|uniref:hypothetical protein n=1 Tax=Streptomyces sp. NPDC048527 TaxID=3365568 RepID=UPI0037193BAF